ncbi:MAG TPA: GlsB/YeaQ/YmgE family stress response membrane protein [Candidatus Acidoferrum sp.]|nr:GlsB/YeaQ/YmgE family stress response membrane protein [Candidatus Acidoferrum sp.]
MLTSILWWIIVGLIAGWAAGRIMRGGGYGPAMDILLGIVGAVVGGWLLGLLGIHAGGLIGTILVAIVGAVFLIWLSRLLKRA